MSEHDTDPPATQPDGLEPPEAPLSTAQLLQAFGAMLDTKLSPVLSGQHEISVAVAALSDKITRMEGDIAVLRYEGKGTRGELAKLHDDLRVTKDRLDELEDKLRALEAPTE